MAVGLLWQAPQLAAAQTATAAWQWATRATSSATTADDYSEGRFIKADGAGNVWSAGTFNGTLTLGSTSLASPGDYDSFVAKYTPTGAVAWVRHLNGTTYETIVSRLVVDGSGNSYVSGYYDGTLVVGSVTLTGGNGFLVKYDPQGTVLWARSVEGYFSGIDCTPAGEVVAQGSFSGTLVLGGTTLTSTGFDSGFLVKYDPQGTVVWARQFEGQANDEGTVSLDAAGNAYIAGQFEGTATFGPITLTSTSGDEDVFVARYSAAGVPQWALRQPVAGPSAYEYVWSMATDPAGNAYLVGASDDRIANQRFFVTQYTPQGTVGWNHLSTATDNSGLLGIATDATGNVYLSGGVAGSFGLGGLTLASSGSADLDLALLSFTAQGAPRWALRAGTAAGTEAALGLALDGANNVYVTGIVQGNTALGPLALPQNSASEEQFVAKASISVLTAAHRARTAEPLLVYPNPARGGAVKVRWSGLAEAPGQLLVHDALGRLVLTSPLPAGRAEAVLPVQGLGRGVYTLRLQTAAATATGRLVVE